MLPLRFLVKVFSGIAPPPALLESANSRPSPAPNRPSVSSSIHTSPGSDAAYPSQLGTLAAVSIEEPPPSYEDAMANEIAPVDGPRRDYSGVTYENAPGEVENTGDLPNSA